MRVRGCFKNRCTFQSRITWQFWDRGKNFASVLFQHLEKRKNRRPAVAALSRNEISLATILKLNGISFIF